MKGLKKHCGHRVLRYQKSLLRCHWIRGEESVQAVSNEEAPLPGDQHEDPAEPEPSASGAQGDQPEIDRLREWDEIGREERLVTAELSRAHPSHPLMGPAHNQLNEYETVYLPFLVITTGYGTVYHCRWDCRYLTAHGTGARKNRRWCLECRREAVQSSIFPSHGAAMFISG